MRRIVLVLLAIAGLAAAPAAAPAPATINVVLETNFGPITILLEMKRAPISAGNFLAYVDQHRLDGTTFYRAARSKRNPHLGLVQGGIDHNMPRSLFPIKHEPTSLTGLRHVDGTISMARNDPGTAMGDFFITIGPAPKLDAHPEYKGDNVGYAAFGHVLRGMEVVHRILALPTYPGGRSLETMGQSIRQPVTIIRAHRAG